MTECPHCAGPRRGVYVTTCLSCCLALLREAPEGQARRATAAHLAARIDGELWDELIAAARAEGLTR